MYFLINGEVHKEQFHNYNIVYYKPVIVERTSTYNSVFGKELDIFKVKMCPLTNNGNPIISTNLAQDVLNNKCKIYEGQFYS